MSAFVQNTAELAQTVSALLGKLFKLQVIAQPQFLLEAVSVCFRVALLAFILFAAVLVIASLTAIFARRWGRAAICGTVLLLCAIAIAWVMRPLPIFADVADIHSISVQTVKNGELSQAKPLIGKARAALLSQLPGAKAVRTPLLALPEMSEGDKIYTLATRDSEVKIVVTGKRVWRMITEKTDFICAFENSAAFLEAIV